MGVIDIYPVIYRYLYYINRYTFLHHSATQAMRSHPDEPGSGTLSHGNHRDFTMKSGDFFIGIFHGILCWIYT